MSLSIRTVKTYETLLTRLEKMGIDINNIIVTDLMKLFDDKKIPLSSQKTYLSAIQWNNKRNNINANSIKSISDQIFILGNKINAQYDKNIYSEKEIEKYISWKTIEKIYDALKKIAYFGDNYIINQDFLLLSLYVLQPPRRALDYQNMYVNIVNISCECDKIIWTNDESIKKYSGWKNKCECKDKIQMITQKNHYMENGNTSFFIFDDYKTFPSFGRQIIEVNIELNEIIKRYITLFGLKLGDKLINLEYNNYFKRLAEIFQLFVGKNISVDMIRHIYISDVVLKSKINDETRKLYAKLMAHSDGMQRIYRKEITFDDNNINLDINRYLEKRKYTEYNPDIAKLHE